MTTNPVSPAADNLFERGPYGEILPPPLIAGVDPEEALQKYLDDSAALGKQLRRPSRGQALEGARNAALLYWHNLRLRRVLAGECQDSVERALYEAIIERGELLSLRPPSLEMLTFPSFAPVLKVETHNGDTNMLWRIGLPAKGRSETFAAEPAQAVARAQKTYVTWCKDDDAHFDDEAQAALAAQPPSPSHDYWLSLLEDQGYWNRGGGFTLTLLGRHTTLQLDLPYGARIIETDRARAVRLCDAMARRANVPAEYPPASEFARWLAERGAETPESVKWANNAAGLPAQIKHAGEEHALVQRGKTLALYHVENGQYTRKVAEADAEGVAGQWLRDEKSRNTLVAWALWKDAQA